MYTILRLQKNKKGSEFIINIEIIKGDITELEVDAIVNAANTSLLGGGGVDGVIHRKAGKQLLEECVKLNGCIIGNAKMTNGYNLKAKFIIHTVAPRWYDFRIDNKEKLLEDCYKNSYNLAKENKIKTIAFPCLGMGIYKVPLDIGARISIDKAIEFSNYFEKIYLVCFRNEEYEYYCKYLKEKLMKV